jgi:hypothetical protein
LQFYRKLVLGPALFLAQLADLWSNHI